MVLYFTFLISNPDYKGEPEFKKAPISSGQWGAHATNEVCRGLPGHTIAHLGPVINLKSVRHTARA